MSFDAGLTLATLLVALVLLAREIMSPDIVLFAALIFLTGAGVLDLEAALSGFSNPVLATIAALLVVAAALRATGALEVASHRVLGRPRSLSRVLLRMTGLTAFASAFINNTTIVAMGMPAITSWGRRNRISPSKLLIPLSYASIVGGLCTLIGTTTNLVGDGLMRATGMPGLGFFELAVVGVPCAIVGVLYLSFAAPRLLKDRLSIRAAGEEVRSYLTEMRLSSPSPLVGRSIEEAGLRHLPGLYLVRIERSAAVLSPVSPAERLHDGDRLTFAGMVETIVDLRRFRGLTPVGSGSSPSEDAPDRTWVLHEAVVSPGSPLVGTNVRDANFRARYNAAVVAVHRHGERIESRIGDIVLRPGDTLLLEATPGFARAYRDSNDFYLVSEVPQSSSFKHHRMASAVLVLLGVVALSALEVLPIALAALAGGLAVVALRCVTPGEAKRAVDFPLLIMIGSALGLAVAMEQSGAAALVGNGIVSLARSWGPTGVLAAVVLATVLLTETVTNTAAAALMFPVAVAAAGDMGADPRPFAIAITLAASLSLSMPLGYQTNLMIYGPGGYRFTDFTRVGLPLQILLVAIVIAVVQWWWGVG